MLALQFSFGRNRVETLTELWLRFVWRVDGTPSSLTRVIRWNIDFMLVSGVLEAEVDVAV